MVAKTRPAVPSTVSDRKRLANQLNAQKSTGPRSDAGRARSSQNARKHGIFCAHLFVAGDEYRAFSVFFRAMLSSMNPRTMVELQSVEQIISDEWRIKRVRAAEQAAFDRVQAQDRQKHEEELAKRRPQRGAAEHSANDGEPNGDPNSELESGFVPTSAGEVMDRLMNEGDELERLSKYEQRLRGSMHRSMKEFRQLRTETYASHDMTELTRFFLEILEEASDAPEPVEEVEVKNEATEDASDDEKTSCDVGEVESQVRKTRPPVRSAARRAPERAVAEPDACLCAV